MKKQKSPPNPTITKHAEQRLSERNGLNKKSNQRIVERVLLNGISHNQTKGRLNKWVNSLWFYNKQANNIKLYGDKAYIFVNEKLITVLQIPSDLTKDMKKMIK